MSMIRQVRRGFFLILWFLFSAVRAWPARSLANRICLPGGAPLVNRF